MFITCNTYRQAAYAPDQQFNGAFTSNIYSSVASSSALLNFNPTTAIKSFNGSTWFTGSGANIT